MPDMSDFDEDKLVEDAVVQQTSDRDVKLIKEIADWLARYNDNELTKPATRTRLADRARLHEDTMRKLLRHPKEFVRAECWKAYLGYQLSKAFGSHEELLEHLMEMTDRREMSEVVDNGDYDLRIYRRQFIFNARLNEEATVQLRRIFWSGAFGQTAFNIRQRSQIRRAELEAKAEAGEFISLEELLGQQMTGRDCLVRVKTFIRKTTDRTGKVREERLEGGLAVVYGEMGTRKSKDGSEPEFQLWLKEVVNDHSDECVGYFEMKGRDVINNHVFLGLSTLRLTFHPSIKNNQELTERRFFFWALMDRAIKEWEENHPSTSLLERHEPAFFKKNGNNQGNGAAQQ